MASALYNWEIEAIDRATSAVTFTVVSTQDCREISLSKGFVLKALVLCAGWNGSEHYGIHRQLSPRLAGLEHDAQAELLESPELTHQHIVKTRIVALENYINWQNIDHTVALEKMIASMDLRVSYSLRVYFADPDALEGMNVGDRLETFYGDGSVGDLAAVLRSDPNNIYGFRDNIQQWRFDAFFTSDNPEDRIAWTDVSHTIMAKTRGLIPWVEGGRWGAIDREGEMIVKCVYEDVEYEAGGLSFKDGQQWIFVGGSAR